MRSSTVSWYARFRAHRLFVAIAAGVISACANGTPPSQHLSQEARVNAPRRPITEVLAEHTLKLMATPGVVGTAESKLANGSPSILVLVVRLTPELRQSIPTELDGYPVVIEESGEIKAMPERTR
jgi:hypothetical protein